METWGDLPKSQVDATTIDEEIDDKIQDHLDDPDAHIEDGQSLKSHKASEIIDHLAKSIVEDKIDDGAISSRCITTDQIIAKDFRTAEDVGATVDGVKFDSDGLEMWQDAEQKVGIPTSGDPFFSGNVNVGFLTFSKTVFMSWFDSIDGWYQDFGGGVVNPLFGGATFEASSVENEMTILGVQPAMTLSLDFSKNPLMQTVFELQDSDANDVFFGLGNDDLGSGKFAGFRVVDGDLHAINRNGGTAADTNLGELALYEPHVYTVKVVSGTSVLFYIDGVLVATHTTYKPTGTDSFFASYSIKSGGDNVVVFAVSNFLFVQDL